MRHCLPYSLLLGGILAFGSSGFANPTPPKGKSANEKQTRAPKAKQNPTVYLFRRAEGGLTLSGCFMPGRRCKVDYDTYHHGQISRSVPCEWDNADDRQACPDRPPTPSPTGKHDLFIFSRGRLSPAPTCLNPKEVDFDLTLAETSLIVTEALREITGQLVRLRVVENERAYVVDLDGDALPDRLYAANVRLFAEDSTRSFRKVVSGAPGAALLKDLRRRGVDFESEGWWILRRGADLHRPRVVRDVPLGFLFVSEACTDLNQNGRPELYLSEGGDAEAEHCMVELSKGRLEVLDCE